MDCDVCVGVSDAVKDRVMFKQELEPVHIPYAPITTKNNIAEYSGRELRALYEWVMSDGVLRTHDEVADVMFSALPFARRGARIEAALRAAITSCESKSSFH